MVELCRILDCERAAQVLLDTELIWIDDDGVENLGVQPVAFCRIHAQLQQQQQLESQALKSVV